MVGLGPSANAFWLESAAWNQNLPWDAVWTVNRASTAFRHDMAWNMHDLRDLARNSKAVAERLRLMEADRPIMTVAAYPEFPMSVRYPIEDVLAFVKHDILSSTPAYMVSYAMMIGVKEIFLYGMDFHFQNVAHAEKGGQGMAYLLGMCQALGIRFNLPHTTSLLASNECMIVTSEGGQPTPLRPLYGYTWDGVNGPRDPRLPTNVPVKVEAPAIAPGMMTAKETPPYSLGEAELGDLRADGQPASDKVKVG